MTIFESAALGLLQGLAEFLPISSSGHLLLAKSLFGLDEVPVLFDIALHLATLGAVCLFFRKSLGVLFLAFFRFIAGKRRAEDADSLRMILAIVLGTACTVVVGLAVERFAPAESLRFVSACFIATASMLVLCEWLGRLKSGASNAAPTWRQAIVVGVAQGIGVLPGISRSGATISGALAAGLGRERAGEFSFLLSIPAILGAFILEFKDADTLMAQVSLANLGVGMLIAFAVGLLALRLFMGLVRQGRLSWFALYLVPLGVLGTIMSF